MDQVQQKVDQGIGEFTTAAMAKRRQESQPQGLGMPAEFVRGFDSSTIAGGLQHFRSQRGKKSRGQGDSANALQFGHLPEEVLQRCTPGIGPEFVEQGTAAGRRRLVPLGVGRFAALWGQQGL